MLQPDSARKRCLCFGSVSKPVLGHAEMVLDLGIFGELFGGFVDEPERPFVYSPLVKDPAERVGHTWVVGELFLRGLRELEGAVLAATFLGQDVRKVVRSSTEARIQLEGALVRSLRGAKVSAHLLHGA